MVRPRSSCRRARSFGLAFVAALAAVAASAGCSGSLISGRKLPSVRELIRESDTAMVAARSYRVDATLGFDVNVLPSVGHVTAHADVVRPDAYVRVKAGSYQAEGLARGGRAYTRVAGGRWVETAALPSGIGVASGYGQSAALLALEAFGDFSSLRSDQPGTDLLRYRLKIGRIAQLDKTILGIIVPPATGILDFVNAKGTIDFNFYLDRGSHRIDDVAIKGDVHAVDIPVKISGAIKYSDYDGTDIQLPNPGRPPGSPQATPTASAQTAGHARSAAT